MGKIANSFLLSSKFAIAPSTLLQFLTNLRHSQMFQENSLKLRLPSHFNFNIVLHKIFILASTTSAVHQLPNLTKDCTKQVLTVEEVMLLLLTTDCRAAGVFLIQCLLS